MSMFLTALSLRTERKKAAGITAGQERGGRQTRENASVETGPAARLTADALPKTLFGFEYAVFLPSRSDPPLLCPKQRQHISDAFR
jgi:hypothetical protein